MKHNFKNDYTQGCHPRILEALAKTNIDQQEGYGKDAYCIHAENLIKTAVNNPHAAVHFVSGGTQANAVVISSILKSYESVISAHTGHINVHEAGAIEAQGHKINTIVSKTGKLDCKSIETILKAHTDEHMVKPRLVYISNATEVGTIYQKSELSALRKFCRSKDLYLFMDGARIGSAIMAEDNDLTLADVCRYADIFYIGGTKNGAMLGEAIVINNTAIQKNFRFHLKQNGALLAKSRIFGVQFAELFRSDLYFNMAGHANEMAQRLTRGMEKLGVAFFNRSSTNQIFPILPMPLIKALEAMYGFYVWQQVNDRDAAIRLVTSWATSKEAVDEFIRDLNLLHQ